MTPQEFATKIKEKYPQYSNVDDVVLTNQIIAKYPAYAKQVNTQSTPLLTKADGGFGTAVKDIAVGAGKSLIEGARGTAQLLQGAGKKVLGAVGVDTTNMGIKSLDDKKISEQLKAKSRGEQVGKVLGTVGELATGFVAAKGPQALTKAKAALNARGEAKALDKTLEAITPSVKDIAPKEYKRLLGQGKISPKSSTQPAQYVLSEGEKATALKYKNLVDKDPVKTSINIMDDIAKKDSEVESFLTANNGIFNGGELKNSILQRLAPITDVSIPDSRVNKLKQTLADGFIKALGKNDMKSLWQARKAFDRSIEKVFNGSPTLQNQVKKEFRNAIQEFIIERTPDDVYKTKMADMTELFRLFDTVSKKATGERSRSALQQWAKNNPTKVKVAGWSAGTGALGLVGGALLGN